MAIEVKVRKAAGGGYRASVIEDDCLFAAVYAPTRAEAVAEANFYAAQAAADDGWKLDPWSSGS